MCVVEYGCAESGEPPAGAKCVAEEDEFTLHFLAEKVNHHVWPVWFLRIDDPSSPAIRLIRLHLLRLHAETETLRSVLDLLADESSASAFAVQGSRSATFDAYLGKAVGLLSRHAHYGQTTSELLDSAYGIRAEVAADTLATVAALVEQAAIVRPVLEPLLNPDNPTRDRVAKTADGGYFPGV